MLIEAELKDRPEVSDRAIATDLGVSHHTVGGVRDDLEDGGQIAHHQDRVGKDGVSQPARKPRRGPASVQCAPHSNVAWQQSDRLGERTNRSERLN